VYIIVIESAKFPPNKKFLKIHGTKMDSFDMYVKYVTIKLYKKVSYHKEIARRQQHSSSQILWASLRSTGVTQILPFPEVPLLGSGYDELCKVTSLLRGHRQNLVALYRAMLTY